MSMSLQEDNALPSNNPKTEEHKDGAVLLSDEITKYCKAEPPLIAPFYESDDHLKAASYHLSIGESVRIDGEDKILSDDNPTVEIQSHGIAMIRTLEKIVMPHDLIGRWNIRATEVYNGLIWVGGPQVDPGYKGPLICPVFNLSTRPYTLKYRYPLFTIDFVKTTRFTEEISKKYIPKRDTSSIGALDIYRTKSALKDEFDKMKMEIKEHKENVEAVQNRMWVIMAILFAALAIISTFGLGTITWNTDIIGTAFVILALVLSITAISIGVANIRKKRNKASIITLTLISYQRLPFGFD